MADELGIRARRHDLTLPRAQHQTDLWTMLSINIKRSVAALALTAGLLTAGAPACHAFSWERQSKPCAYTVMAPVSPHDLERAAAGLRVRLVDRPDLGL